MDTLPFVIPFTEISLWILGAIAARALWRYGSKPHVCRECANNTTKQEK